MERYEGGSVGRSGVDAGGGGAGDEGDLEVAVALVVVELTRVGRGAAAEDVLVSVESDVLTVGELEQDGRDGLRSVHGHARRRHDGVELVFGSGGEVLAGRDVVGQQRGGKRGALAFVHGDLLKGRTAHLAARVTGTKEVYKNRMLLSIFEMLSKEETSR